MGRQSRMIQLALGQSAYEPLRSSTTEEPVDGQEDAGDTIRIETQVPNSVPYEQQYDSRGYPENPASRLLNRQSRRAQNDVLARIGVCYHIGEAGQTSKSVLIKKHPSIDDSRTKAVRRENEIGLLIAAADLGLFCLAGTCLLGLRHRMQAFRFYAGVPVLDILKTEWKHLGPLQFLLGGAPASLAYLVLDLGRHYFIRSLYNSFTRRVVWNVSSRKRRHKIRWIMDVVENILKVGSFSIIAPLEIYAALQRLGLISGWPILPNPMALIPFTSLSLVQAPNLPSNISLRGCVQLAKSLILSPLTLWWILFYGKIHVDKKLYGYLRLALPKPENPDSYSIKGALEDDLDNDTVPGLGFIKDHENISIGYDRGLFDEVKKDVLALVNGFWKLVSEPIRRKKEEEPEEEEPEEEEPEDEEPEEGEPEEENLSDSEEELSQIPHYNLAHSRPLYDGHLLPTIEDSMLAIQAIGIPENSDDNIPFLYRHGETQTETSIVPDTPAPRSSRPASPSPMTSSATVPPPDPETRASPTPTNTTPTNTFQPPTDLSSMPQSDEPHTNNISEPPIPKPLTPSQPRPTYHRVTALTAHLADAMGSHLSTHLADILFLPLESLFIRSVALSFFSLPLFIPYSPHLQPHSLFLPSSPRASPAAALLRAEIFPPGTWFGVGLHGGWGRIVDYAARMALCSGLEVCVGYVVWQLGAGAVWWLGFRWFQWQML